MYKNAIKYPYNYSYYLKLRADNKKTIKAGMYSILDNPEGLKPVLIKECDRIQRYRNKVDAEWSAFIGEEV